VVGHHGGLDPQAAIAGGIGEHRVLPEPFHQRGQRLLRVGARIVDGRHNQFLDSLDRLPHSGEGVPEPRCLGRQ
jgi:hypothetical protein